MVAVVRTLLTRADRICSNVPDRDVEKKQVAGALSNNGYPTRLVKRNWQPSPQPTSTPEPDTCKAVVVVPYIRHFSESIRRILSLLGIRTYFRPYHTLRQVLVKLKDQVPVQQRAGVIYRIPCKDCPEVYVGQTGRTLAHRLKEHKRTLTSGNLAQSAVAEHATQQSHAIDWECATVIDTEQPFHRRCTLESWHIRSETNAMNREEGNLPPVYDLLIHRPHSTNQ